MSDRSEFFEFIQHTAIEFISQVIQQKASSGEEEEQNKSMSRQSVSELQNQASFGSEHRENESMIRSRSDLDPFFMSGKPLC